MRFIEPKRFLQEWQSSYSICKTLLSSVINAVAQNKPLIGDRGISRQQQQAISSFPQRLSATEANAIFSDYPKRGVQPIVDLTGLDFLPAEITEACVCLATVEAKGLKARWLGRNPLNNTQFWSATKIIPLLNVVAQTNANFPTVPLDHCEIRQSGCSKGRSLYDTALNIVSYRQEHLPDQGSNALSAVLKRFETYAGLETWIQTITGNPSLEFRGNYGRAPSIDFPELVEPNTQQVLLKAAPQTPKGHNHVSAYDLTRLVSMLGWHPLLPEQAQLPGLQESGWSLLVRSLAHDCARYMDEALARLDRDPLSCVILSKDGYGYSDERGSDEVIYTAFLQISAPAPSLAITLRAVRSNKGRPNSQRPFLDALMAEAVTEILARFVEANVR